MKPTVDGVARFPRKSSSNFFRRMLDQARDIILLVGEDAKILYANQAATDAYGYSKQELLNLSVPDLRSPEMIPLLQDQLKQAFTEGISFRSSHQRKNGEHFPVEVSSRKLHLTHFDAVISIVRDINKRVGIY